MQTRTTIQINVISPWRVENSFMIAPVIIMVEGVHHGNHGAIYWAGHILQQNAHKWEGVPVVINHPEVEGRAVSVDYNQETKSRIIGTVRNPSYDSAKKALKAEIHVPLNNSKISLSKLQDIKEVSAGVFSDEVYGTGNWKDEQYTACSITMEPDHLALLPDSKGACSWEDGAGIRANQRSVTAIFKEALQTLLNKENEHMEEILLPSGIEIYEKKNEEQDLLVLQSEADENNMLLPTEFNYAIGKPRNKHSDEDNEILMPCGY